MGYLDVGKVAQVHVGRTFCGVIVLANSKPGLIPCGERVDITIRYGKGSAHNFTVDPEERYVVVAQDGLEFYELRTGRHLLTLYEVENGGAVVLDPAGRFDLLGIDEEEAPVHFIRLGPDGYPEVVLLSQLASWGHCRGLYTMVLEGRAEDLARECPVSKEELGYWPDVELETVTGSKRLAVVLRDRGSGIGRVELRLNGGYVTADAHSLGKVERSGWLRRLLKMRGWRERVVLDLQGLPRLLVDAWNVVEVRAYDGSGRIASRPVTAIVWVGGERERAPELWVVAVGVSDYREDGLDLSYAAQDAEAFAEAVSLAGLGIYRHVHRYVLTSPVISGSRSASKEELREVLAEIGRRSRSYDGLVLYLSGHGFALTGGGRGSARYAFAFPGAYELSEEAYRRHGSFFLSDLELAEWLGSLPPTKVAVVLDTCFSGAAGKALLVAMRGLGSWEAVSRRYLRDRVKEQSGAYFLFGSAPDRASYEATPFGHGILTYALIEGMQGPGLEVGGVLSVGRWFTYAQGRVRELGRFVGVRQDPEVLVPRGGGFDLGQVTEAVRRRLDLSPPLPVVVQPRFVQPETGLDPLGLEGFVRERLADRFLGGERVRRGAPRFVYVEVPEVAGGLKPVGRYWLRGEKVVVELQLARDERVVAGPYRVRGKRTRLRELVQVVTMTIVESAVSVGGVRLQELPAQR
jgi:hypothetical protein